MNIASNVIYASCGCIDDFCMLYANQLHIFLSNFIDSSMLPLGEVVMPTYLYALLFCSLVCILWVELLFVDIIISSSISLHIVDIPFLVNFHCII